MFQIVIERYAQKQLDTIDSPYFEQIISSIQELSLNPRPFGYKKLRGNQGYRIRIGVYRVIYRIEDKLILIYVIDIDHRWNIYN